MRHPDRRRVTLTSLLVGASVALAPAAVAAPLGTTVDVASTASTASPEAAGAAACAAMTVDVHGADQPGSGSSLVSTFPGEVVKAARFGFTEARGVVFRAATSPAAGLSPVHRMYQPDTGDFLWILTERGRRNGRAALRLPVPAGRLLRLDGARRVRRARPPLPQGRPAPPRGRATTSAARSRRPAGARGREVLGGAARGRRGAPGGPPPGPAARPRTPGAPGTAGPRGRPATRTFTIAVLPDTQYEVFGDDLFAQRNRWLVRNRDALDLRFALHTGDVVSWDTPGHAQYERASAAMKVLDDAGVPTAVAIGNHDTAAVAVGGSAVPGGDTKRQVRDTRTFNRYFPASRFSPEGVFEPGKVDNTVQLFSAGGEDWMVLTLELWPRRAVVEWARDVVAAHPDRLVVVQTHSYLRSDGSISRRHEYGATSPRVLYDRLISVYPNIRMVFSGHVGTATSRVDVGRHGNRIVSFLGTFHSRSSNPVRLVEIDTAAGTVDSQFVSPIDGRSWSRYDTRVTGMDLS